MTDRLDSIMKDLEESNYWDKQLLGNGISRLQLRQEWDRETNNQIRDRIIQALIYYRIASESESKQQDRY